jgi:hypothetical protein
VFSAQQAKVIYNPTQHQLNIIHNSKPRVDPSSYIQSYPGYRIFYQVCFSTVFSLLDTGKDGIFLMHLN